MFSMRRRFPVCISLLFFILGGNLVWAQFDFPMEIPDLWNRRADTLYVDVETHDFGVPGLENVQTLAYNHDFSGSNDYLGPSLTWIVGDTQSTNITNRLPDTSGMTTTVHWHGANIPAWTDGGPHQFFGPGEDFTAKFKVLDRPTTLWYHPHAEDVTYTQVQMGLAGLIYVREPGDPVEAISPHTYGHDDIPLIIQDIYFDTTATGLAIDTTQGPPGSASRRRLVVNGDIQPYLQVPPQPIRFRILDGSTRNSYLLGFVADTTNPMNSKIPFALLASDGGYLPDNVVFVDSIETSTGIRNEIIIDFSSYADQDIYLKNFSSQLPAGVIGRTSDPNRDTDYILQIRVGGTPFAPIGAIPASLPPIAPLPSPDTSRIIRLTGKGGSNPIPFTIDNNQYDFNQVNTIVRLNTTEDWTIRNESNVAHPFHMHLVQFFVQSREDTAGNPLPFPVKYLGPKDNILVYPGEQVTFRVHFDTYSRPKPFTPETLDSAAYMYHCHILTHEDGYYGGNPGTIAGRSPFGMMQQFVVWDGTVTDVDEPLEEEMVLFPNPARDMLHLNGESAKMSTVRILDLQGRLLIKKVLPPFYGTIDIDVSRLNQGMILVEWERDEQRQIKKVILE